MATSDITNKIPLGLNKGAQSTVTVAPGLADANIAATYQTLNNGTNYFTAVLQPGNETYVTDVEVRAALAYRDAFRQGDVVSALNLLYNGIQTKYFNAADCSFDTIVYWAQKFLYGNKEIIALNNKGSIFGNKLLPNLNPAVSKFLTSSFVNGLDTLTSQAASSLVKGVANIAGTFNPSLAGNLLSQVGLNRQSFFEVYSDSIGTLANSKYLQLDSTLPIFDVTQNYYGVPIPYSASTDNKISNNTRNISYNLSLGCTALMRRNLINVAYTQPMIAENMATDATVAHGHNLINDLPTFVQLNYAVPTLVKTLSKVFKVPRVFQFIQYLCTIGNKVGVNLRDIFPVTNSDKDFIVVTSAERALASEAEIKSISDDAIVQAYAEQQGINYGNQYGAYAIYQPGGGVSGSGAPGTGDGALARTPGPRQVTLNQNADGTTTVTGRATIFGFLNGQKDPGDNGKGTLRPDGRGIYLTANPDIMGIAVPFKVEAGVKVAIYNGVKGGDLFLAQVPGQDPIVVPVVDNGPSTWTKNAVDFTHGAAAATGFAKAGAMTGVSVRPLTQSEAQAVLSKYPNLYLGYQGATAARDAASIVLRGGK